MVAVVYARASVCVPFLLLFYSVDPSMSRPNKAVQCMGEYHCTVGSGGCSPLFSPEPSESEAEATTGGGREAAACHTSGSSYTSLLPPLSYQQAEEGRERGVGGQGKTQEGRRAAMERRGMDGWPWPSPLPPPSVGGGGHLPPSHPSSSPTLTPTRRRGLFFSLRGGGGGEGQGKREAVDTKDNHSLLSLSPNPKPHSLFPSSSSSSFLLPLLLFPNTACFLTPPFLSSFPGGDGSELNSPPPPPPPVSLLPPPRLRPRLFVLCMKSPFPPSAHSHSSPTPAFLILQRFPSPPPPLSPPSPSVPSFLPSQTCKVSLFMRL